MARILCCCGCGVGQQLQLQFDPYPGNLHVPGEQPLKKKEKKKEKKKKNLSGDVIPIRNISPKFKIKALIINAL